MPERAMRAAAWTKVAFGDVVRQVKDRVDPEQSGLERYVAGEHMDTDDLRLRRWGDIGDGYLGPAFHMRFKPGHVLYGSRRTYLRKVVVADFEGITANTTYVLEPKDPNVLLPELLPFVMQTEAFNHHSVRESKGSVNPYVNFSDLAWYEFALPPIEKQRRLALALASIDGAVRCLGELEDSEEIVRDSLFDSLIGRDRNRREAPVSDFCEFVTDGDHNPPPRVESGIPHVVVANLQGGGLDLRGCTYITASDYERVRKRYSPRGGDVLVSCVGSIGATALVPDELAFSADRSLAVYRPIRSVIHPEFLFWLLRSRRSQQYFASVATGTAQMHLYLNDLRRQKVRVPNIDIQVAIISRMREIEATTSGTRMKAAALLPLRASILCGMEAAQ